MVVVIGPTNCNRWCVIQVDATKLGVVLGLGIGKSALISLLENNFPSVEARLGSPLFLSDNLDSCFSSVHSDACTGGINDTCVVLSGEEEEVKGGEAWQRPFWFYETYQGG